MISINLLRSSLCERTRYVWMNKISGNKKPLLGINTLNPNARLDNEDLTHEKIHRRSRQLPKIIFIREKKRGIGEEIAKSWGNQIQRGKKSKLVSMSHVAAMWKWWWVEASSKFVPSCLNCRLKAAPSEKYYQESFCKRAQFCNSLIETTGFMIHWAHCVNRLSYGGNQYRIVICAMSEMFASVFLADHSSDYQGDQRWHRLLSSIRVHLCHTIQTPPELY